MKTYSLLCVGALTVCSLAAARVSASPSGFYGRQSPYRTYARDGITELHADPILRDGPRRWSFGAYAELQRRRIEPVNGGGLQNWDADTVMFTLGYDLLKPLTLTVGGGASDFTLGNRDYGSDGIWVASANIRLLDYYVFDPLKHGDLYWCRIDSTVQYGESDIDSSSQSFKRKEFRASLTAAFVNRPYKLRSVSSVGLYVGPLYSQLSGRDTFGDWRGIEYQGRDEFGFVVGIFANPGNHTMLKIELNRLERNSLNLAAGFHF